MSLAHLACGFSALLLCFALSGCDAGSTSPEITTNQSELERFLAENPDVEVGMDTGEEDESEDE